MRGLLLLMSVCVGYSQGTNATLEGQVTDPSGAVIGGAMVKAVSAETGYTRVQATTSAGAYHLLLPVGPYELRVSVPNFGEYVRSGIQLEVGQTARIDVRLQVAKEKEIVNVDARAPRVDSGSNVVGNVVTGRELVELPLNGRNFTQLGLLQPGVAPITAGLAEAGGSLRATCASSRRPASSACRCRPSTWPARLAATPK